MERPTRHPARSRASERGASLVEYALLIALIAMVCFVTLQSFGVTNGGSINNTASTIDSVVRSG